MIKGAKLSSADFNKTKVTYYTLEINLLHIVKTQQIV